MSAVRYSNDVPHIVRYGMHDEMEEKCWILFWRNGTQFIIHVDKEDMYGTAFYPIWRPLLRETPEEGETIMDHMQKQWHALCDLIIFHSMVAREKVAPVKPYWITLRDYLHTPGYVLKLVMDKEAGSVHPELTKDERPGRIKSIRIRTSLRRGVQKYAKRHSTLSD